MKPAIAVRSLSKSYRIGTSAGRQGYRTLRESFMSAVRSVGRRRARRHGASDHWALRDVSFKVEPGEVVGVIGRNGAGKSTLLKALTRIIAPTVGEIILRGRVGSLLEVGTGFHPELTGRENIYLNGAILGMRRAEIQRKFDDIVAFSEVEQFLDTPVKRYSSGMYMKLAFAVASHLEPEILLVDEVLAVGDAQFQKKCLGKMGEVSREGRTVLFVSHNMTAIKSLCTRGILIEAGRVALDGHVDDVVDRYLSGGTEMAKTGIIPHDVPRYSDRPGVAYVRSVRMTDLNGNDTTQLYFGQPFQVHVACDIVKAVPDALFEVSISTPDGTQVTLSTTLDGGGTSRNLAPGRHEFVATVEGVTLLPRQYAVTVGIHHLAGATIDFIERALDFTVLRIAESGEDHYPWPQTRGLVRAPVSWHEKRSNRAVSGENK